MTDFLKGVGDALSAVNPALGVASNIIGGLFGAGNQKSANETNLEIARMNAQAQRETNAMNERLFHESNVFSEKMWNKANEYNSPSAQVQRLINAGINPAFVMGNGSTAEASALQSAAAPHMDAPVMNASVQPFDPSPYVHGAFTAANAFTKNQLDNAMADETRSRTSGNNVQNTIALLTMMDKVENSHLDKEEKDIRMKILRDTWKDFVAISHGNVKQQEAQTDNLIQSTASMKARDLLAQQAHDLQVKLTDAQINGISSQIALNAQSIADMIQRLDIDRENAAAYRSALGNQVIHLLNQDSSVFEQLGISKELMSSEKFKNYLGSVTQTLYDGILSYMLFKGVKAPAPIRGFGH